MFEWQGVHVVARLLASVGDPSGGDAGLAELRATVTRDEDASLSLSILALSSSVCLSLSLSRSLSFFLYLAFWHVGNLYERNGSRT